MNSLTDFFKFHNGITIPCVGYGTYLTTNEEACDVVCQAIATGYRHIDTAYFYMNECGVGEAIKKCGVPREDLFVTSKVWNDDRGYQETKDAFERTMKNLDLEYLDLLLIHWPANKKQFGEDAKMINAETWRAFEELYNTGRIKAIGLSNFLPHHIDELMETATIAPMINQIEFHPGWMQADVVEYCKAKGIVLEAWSPLGRSKALSSETLVALGEKYGKSSAQICIRWVLQHGLIPLPKSSTFSRIISNAEIFDFELSEDDMKLIDSLKDLGGQCALPDEVDF